MLLRMSFCKERFFFPFFLFFITLHLQKEVAGFPQLLTETSHLRYFTVKKSCKLSHGNPLDIMKVYNSISCVQQCTRKADMCTAVNFEKRATNGQHTCELMTRDMYGHPLLHDEEFDYITVQLPIHSNCADIHKNQGKQNGVYHIAPVLSRPLQVYCDMNTSGGGWTVIQKRIDGSVNFSRDWVDYKRGFGNQLGEYWLGLDNLHVMTSQRSYRLRLDLEDFEGDTRYAEYDSFIVADEADNYRLAIGQYSGNAGDSLTYHSGMQFSTEHRDNDQHDANCAAIRQGGWWYNACTQCNPNGRYHRHQRGAIAVGVTWSGWRGYDYSLKRMELKIKPVTTTEQVRRVSRSQRKVVLSKAL